MSDTVTEKDSWGQNAEAGHLGERWWSEWLERHAFCSVLQFLLVQPTLLVGPGQWA